MLQSVFFRELKVTAVSDTEPLTERAHITKLNNTRQISGQILSSQVVSSAACPDTGVGSYSLAVAARYADVIDQTVDKLRRDGYTVV